MSEGLHGYILNFGKLVDDVIELCSKLKVSLPILILHGCCDMMKRLSSSCLGGRVAGGYRRWGMGYNFLG
ncbi:hypothetical protein SLEP1_g27388 [Rubroshorea leprosula]|uniref:Uncharacterized protein n=1 Tax=Rubroshorea leprosula TaxID=152421 RepID=A0AAV5JQD9_9ROSI|nr:hypothetical protein SLEP1_g27388 [Rubroshorea leprosula]